MLQQRRHVAILANPLAGRRSNRKFLDELTQALAQKELEPVVCWKRTELTALLPSYRDQLRCVVAAGGDGTLNDVLNQVTTVPTAIFPLGNENLVAQHFGLRTSAVDLAETIAAAHWKALDLGRVGERYFSIMVSAGFDAEVVHQVHKQRQGHVSKLSYAWQIARGLPSYAFPGIEVEVIDTGERLCGAMAFVFNLPRYGLGLPIAPKAHPADGWLDLYVFQCPGVRHLLHYLWAVSRRQHERMPDVQHRRVTQVRLWSEHTVPVQADGDPVGYLPVSVEVVPRAWSLITPA
jgi:YegS/Rv2252/BmrU family lipid kinase